MAPDCRDELFKQLQDSGAISTSNTDATGGFCRQAVRRRVVKENSNKDVNL